MFNLHYSVVDNCMVLAYDPQTREEVWRRSLRTYFRNTRKMPIIKLQVRAQTISAIWMGSSVILDSDNGKVIKYIRSMQLDDADAIIIV